MGKPVAVVLVVGALFAALVLTLPQTRGEYGRRLQVVLDNGRWGLDRLLNRAEPASSAPEPLSRQQLKDKALVDAIQNRSYKGAVAALKAGASPNARGYWIPKGTWAPGDRREGPTALMLAVVADTPQDHLKTIDLLLDWGAAVNAHDAGGYTALEVAELYERTRAARLLRRHGAERSSR